MMSRTSPPFPTENEKSMSEKVTDVKDRTVNHFRNNWKYYAVTGVGIAIGVAGTTVTVRKGPEVMAVQKIIGPSWKPVQTIIQFVERSTPSKPLHLVGTHQYFDGVLDAARKTGHSASMISRNINGHIADVKGDVFEVVNAV